MNQSNARGHVPKIFTFALLLILWQAGEFMGSFLRMLHNHVLCVMSPNRLSFPVSEFVLNTFRRSAATCIYLQERNAFIYPSSLHLVVRVVNLAIVTLVIALALRKYRYCHLVVGIGYAVNFLMFCFFLTCLTTPLFVFRSLLGDKPDAAYLGNPQVGDVLYYIGRVLHYVLTGIISFTVFWWFIKKCKLFKTNLTLEKRGGLPEE
ncbi:MAG: hypothetical protein FWG50_12310 [Kiritimatiellaeota bacterium]|nr:hypothetical protein [Kiritimatiellota bacterium]